MDLDVLMNMTTFPELIMGLQKLQEEYNTLFHRVNEDYIRFNNHVFNDTIDKETPEELTLHLNDIIKIRKQKLNNQAALDALLQRFESFKKMKDEEANQIRVLNNYEMRINQLLGRSQSTYQPQQMNNMNNNRNEYNPMNPMNNMNNMNQMQSYEPKMPQYPREWERNDHPPKRSKPQLSERSLSDPLIQNAMSKILKRIRKRSGTCIYDSEIDGWNKETISSLLEGLSSIMIIVYPYEDRIFGCYIDNTIRLHQWNGDDNSFLCALHGNDFFWVHGTIKGAPRLVDLFRICEEDDENLFMFTKWITFQGTKGLAKSHFDKDILKVVHQKAGTFIGEADTKYFRLDKFIILHFKD